MAAKGNGRNLRGWARRKSRARSFLYETQPQTAPRVTSSWFFEANPIGDAGGLGTATGVGGSIAASAGAASGTSNVTGGSFPPLSIGRAAVVQLSYRNPANPISGTIVAGGADLTVSSINTTTNELTVTGHGFIDYSGDGPTIWDTTGGTVPGGLTNGAPYWIGIVDANTLKVATSDVNAATGVWVDITSTGSGTHTLKRAQATQTAQSIIIAAAIRGDWDNTPGAPYDNYGNTFTSVDAGPYSYSAWPTAKMGVFSSPYNVTAGGLDHRVSLDYGPYAPAGAEADEVTVGWVEVLGPAEVIATSYQEVTVPAASFNSASITISRKARIICIVGGSSGLGQHHVFTFSGIAGITKIPAASAESEISANGYCQLSMAHADVDPAGTPTTYTATIAGTSNEVGKVWLVAVAVPQVGLASGTSTATGVSTVVAAAAGSATGTGSADAGGQAVVAAAGSAAGTGTASGAAASGDGAGAASGTGTATGVGTAIYSSPGSASGTSTPAAVGASTAAAAGSASGTSTPAAVGASTAAGAGAATGTGTPTATGASTAAAGGSSSGTSTSSATGAATAAGAGASSGAATAAAVGGAIAAGAGASAGSGDATSVGGGTQAGAGSAAGTGTAGAVATAIVAAVGSASGTGTATGVATSGVPRPLPATLTITARGDAPFTVATFAGEAPFAIAPAVVAPFTVTGPADMFAIAADPGPFVVTGTEPTFTVTATADAPFTVEEV